MTDGTRLKAKIPIESSSLVKDYNNQPEAVVVGGKLVFSRSLLEQTHAHFLQAQEEAGRIACWSHETTTLFFKGVKQRPFMYIPDFDVFMLDGHKVFHELTGHLEYEDCLKFKLVSEKYPHAVISLIMQSIRPCDRDKIRIAEKYVKEVTTVAKFYKENAVNDSQ